MDFIQRVLNGMASRRPRLDALRDSWQDLDTHYDRWRAVLALLPADDGAGEKKL
jgi:acyl carrier protein phosphodiesterase